MPIEQVPEVVFPETDWGTPTWLRLCKYFQQQITTLHIQLENPKRTEVETAVIRGRIKELRSLLLLSESAPAQPVDDA